MLEANPASERPDLLPSFSQCFQSAADGAGTLHSIWRWDT